MSKTAHKLIKLTALILCLLFAPDTALSQAGLGGPEDARIGCQTARQCPSPRLAPGQDARCVYAACINNVCTNSIAVGRNLGIEPAGNLACYARPLICSSTGTAVPDTNPSNQVAQNEGQVCVYSSTLPTCTIGRCRNKACVQENNDGAACTNAPLTPCQKGLCQGGFCSAVADPQKAGTQCQAPRTSGCVTTEYQCTSTGICNGRNVVAAGQECASGVGYNSNSSYLPSGFRALFSGATAPRYGCTSSCKLEYCGDAKVQSSLGEACDSSATPGSNTVCSNCQVACAVGSTRDGAGNCCPSSQKDSRGFCCPGGRTPACGSCDGCKGCPTSRCRFGNGQNGWPMNHLAPDCAPWAQWFPPPVHRLDFHHGQSFYKVFLTADSNAFKQPLACLNGQPECRAPGKSGWIYTTNPQGEIITPAEWETHMNCTCYNGNISCSCNTGKYPHCIAFNSIGCTVGGYEKMAGIRHLGDSGGAVGNATWSHCTYPEAGRCVFCGWVRPAGQGCFDPNTEILLEEGIVKRAHQIRVGDRLYNPLSKSAVEVRKISHGPEAEPMVEFGFEGFLLKVTRTHPVLTLAGMRRAEDIKVGDVVFDAFGVEQTIRYVRQAELDPNQQVFNFELASDSGEYMDRLLVGGNIVSGDLSVQNGRLEGE